MLDKVSRLATAVARVVVALEHLGDHAGAELLEALGVSAAEDRPEDVTHGLQAFSGERRVGGDRRPDLSHEPGLLAARLTTVGRSGVHAVGSARGAVSSWPKTTGLRVPLQNFREG